MLRDMVFSIDQRGLRYHERTVDGKLFACYNRSGSRSLGEDVSRGGHVELGICAP